MMPVHIDVLAEGPSAYVLGSGLFAPDLPGCALHMEPL